VEKGVDYHNYLCEKQAFEKIESRRLFIPKKNEGSEVIRFSELDVEFLLTT
jgi:hypothetical protein